MAKYYTMVKLYDNTGKMIADAGAIIELDPEPAQRHLERGNVRRVKSRSTKVKVWEAASGNSNGKGTEQQDPGEPGKH